MTSWERLVVCEEWDVEEDAAGEKWENGRESNEVEAEGKKQPAHRIDSAGRDRVRVAGRSL